MSVLSSHASRVSAPLGSAGASFASAADTVVCAVNINSVHECVDWPAVLRFAGWRAHCRRGAHPACRRIEWLVKNKQHVFAFQQLELASYPQQLRLPAECAEEILRLFEQAGLLAN